jgi:hypothetical protein
MKLLLRRFRYLGYAAAVLAWLAVMLLPCFVFALVARGELEWRRGDYDSDRIWLIQERRQRGLGYQSERILSDERASGGALCVHYAVRYFLWEGQLEAGANNDFLECYATDGTAIGSPSLWRRHTPSPTT